MRWYDRVHTKKTPVTLTWLCSASGEELLHETRAEVLEQCVEQFGSLREKITLQSNHFCALALKSCETKLVKKGRSWPDEQPLWWPFLKNGLFVNCSRGSKFLRNSLKSLNGTHRTTKKHNNKKGHQYVSSSPCWEQPYQFSCCNI